MIVGVGEPVAVGVNVPAVPSVNVVDVAEVMAAGALPDGPGTAVQVNPLVSPAAAANVTSVFQLSTRSPLVSAQASPDSQMPVADAPDPV